MVRASFMPLNLGVVVRNEHTGMFQEGELLLSGDDREILLSEMMDCDSERRNPTEVGPLTTNPAGKPHGT